MKPGAVFVIHDHFIQVLHKHSIIFRIFLLTGHMIKNCRGIDRFRKSPVHTVMYHRFAIPICRVYNSRCTICVPAVFYCCCVKVFCCLKMFFQFFFLFSTVCKRPLCDQPCPFDSMSRCCAVWLERIIRTVTVAVKICYPFLRKMFRDPPGVIFCPLDHMINDPACTNVIFFIPGDISCCQKSLYRMHIGI